MNKRSIIKFVDNLLLRILRYQHVNSLFHRNNMIRNIGFNPMLDQPKVLICYLTEPFFESVDNIINHPKNYQLLQMVEYFLNRGYNIDVCNYVDDYSVQRMKTDYDIIIGQGIAYNRAIKILSCRISILFLTENNPYIVHKNYKERLEYFKERHPNVNYMMSIPRIGIFNSFSLEQSNAIIAFNSRSSAYTLKEFTKSVYPITVNTVGNSHENVESSTIVKNKKNFVWLGSVGFIHKGLDILLDAFKELPDCKLNVYGIPKSEIVLWNKLKGDNTILHPYVDVTSDRFVEEVIKQNTFVISASCSEGIQTGIATCMRSGLIPIVTRDCGYDDHKSIFMLEDYHVEYIVERLSKIISLEDHVLINKSESAREYSNKKFTNEQFTIELNCALDNILSENEKTAIFHCNG